MPSRFSDDSSDCMMFFRALPPALGSPGEVFMVNLVPITQRSRWPFMNSPSSVSLVPWV